MRKISIKEILFWVFLVIGIMMALWRIFGNSPTDLQIIAPFVVMIVMKMWSMNDKLVSLEITTKNSFNRMKEDLNSIKKNVEVLVR